MAISNTYLGMQLQLADECGDDQSLLAPLADSALTLSPIKLAIQSAIAKWERWPFYFNDLRLEPTAASPFKTVQGQEFYGAMDYAPLATIATIKSVRVLVTGNRYPLTPRDSNWMNDVSINPDNTGQPTQYSYDALQMRMYPIPDNAYPVGLTGTLRLSALVNDGDTNAWMQDAFDLIRCEAKTIIGRDVTYDEDVERSGTLGVYGNEENGDPGYFRALMRETAQRKSARTYIRPVYF